MAANFRSVNNSNIPFPADSHVQKNTDITKVISPSTPRPNTAPQSLPAPPQSTMDDATTPTRANFNSGAHFSNNSHSAGMATQKPLPQSPFPEGAMDTTESTPNTKSHARANSSVSKKSRDSDEMDVDDSDNDTAGEEDGDSDGEGSLNADGTRSSRKKKGNQRFFCKGYPPCKLSFTRSEHLARHIR